jgi:hypothetical protein
MLIGAIIRIIMSIIRRNKQTPASEEGQQRRQRY